MNIFGNVYSTDSIPIHRKGKMLQFGVSQMYKLFDYVGKPIKGEDERLLFESLWQHKILKKNSLLVKEGEPNESIYFVLEGSLMLYNDINFEQHIFMLLNEGNFVLTLNSFKRGGNSLVNIAACQTTHLLEINRKNIQLLAETEYGSHFSQIIDHLIGEYDKYLHKIMLLLRLKSQDKLLALYELNPELVKTVPGKYIAAFLDLQTETFSRVRKKLSQQNPEK